MTEAGGVSPPLADVLASAARVWSEFVSGQSIDRAIAAVVPADRARLRAAVQDISYGAIRRRAFSERVIAELASRPPAVETGALLCVALPQLMAGRHAAHTVVDQAVAAARMQPATAGAAGFVNAVLRNFLRRQDELLERLQRVDEVRYNAPAWWIDAVRTAHPEQWREILATGFERTGTRAAREPAAQQRRGLSAAPRCARHARHSGRAPGGVAAAARSGRAHSGFRGRRCLGAGRGGAAGRRVARRGRRHASPRCLRCPRGQVGTPGRAGRSRPDRARDGPATRAAHRRESAPHRSSSVPRSSPMVGTYPHGGTAGRTTASCSMRPCTASGIVRRHPDIPWLRRKADVAHLATVQAQLLEALWPLLGVGGRLLYVVCSVFPQEGSEQIARFVGRHPEAVARPLPGRCAVRATAAVRGNGRDLGRWPALADDCTTVFSTHSSRNPDEPGHCAARVDRHAAAGVASRCACAGRRAHRRHCSRAGAGAGRRWRCRAQRHLRVRDAAGARRGGDQRHRDLLQHRVRTVSQALVLAGSARSVPAR